MQIAGAPDDIDERCGQDGLVDVPKRAVLHGLHRGLRVRTPGEDHYRDVEIVLARRTQKLQSAHAGHHQIGHDHVESLDRQALRREPRIAFRNDRPARARENLPMDLTHGLFVVHEQNPAAGLAHTVGCGLECIGMEVRARREAARGCLCVRGRFTPPSSRSGTRLPMRPRSFHATVVAKRHAAAYAKGRAPRSWGGLRVRFPGHVEGKPDGETGATARLRLEGQ